MNIQLEKIELIKRIADVNNKAVISKLKAILFPENTNDETNTILSKPQLIKKIRAARKEIKEGKGIKLDPNDIWK